MANIDLINILVLLSIIIAIIYMCIKENIEFKTSLGGILLIVIVYYLVYRYTNTKKMKIKKLSTAEIWDSPVNMNKPYLIDIISSKIDGPPGYSYTMSMNITEWMYNSDVEFREIFTHGEGSFTNMGSNDVLSVAINGHRNDIHIKINTKQHSAIDTITTCTDIQSGDDNLNIITTEEVIVKYFPIAKWFHFAIVLAKNRVDVYIDGKLIITKILPGQINLPTTDSELDGSDNSVESNVIKCFKGEPIKGEISKFKAFDSELPLKLIQDIYAISTNNELSSQLPSDYYDYNYIESECN